MSQALRCIGFIWAVSGHEVRRGSFPHFDPALFFRAGARIFNCKCFGFFGAIKRMHAGARTQNVLHSHVLSSCFPLSHSFVRSHSATLRIYSQTFPVSQLCSFRRSRSRADFHRKVQPDPSHEFREIRIMDPVVCMDLCMSCVYK